MINVAGQTFIQYQIVSNGSNQIIKGYEVFTGDDKFQNDGLNKVFEEKYKIKCNF